jgi:hypothetical protein
MIFGLVMVEGVVREGRVAVVQGHRYPVEVISHCVWLSHRFPLGYREVEELVLSRGVIVSYGTVRRWCVRSGQTDAGALRRRKPGAGDKWLYLLPGSAPAIRRVVAPREPGVADKWLPSCGFRCLAARLPTTTRPPIGKCEKVAV